MKNRNRIFTSDDEIRISGKEIRLTYGACNITELTQKGELRETEGKHYKPKDADGI